MNIGQASKASGVTAKMIRYYDEIDLVRPASRTGSNYREYDDRQINELRFIKRARNLGFSMEEITQLLSLWRDRARPSRDVKAIADRHVADLDTHRRDAGHGRYAAPPITAARRRPDCPILADLTEGAEPSSLGGGPPSITSLE